MPAKQNFAFTNIILWRHAQATEIPNFVDFEKDLARTLTQKGQKQAKKMARWLIQNKTANMQLTCSAALRARETALALQPSITVNEAYNPGASLQQVLKALANLDQTKDIILVGHAPWLGQLAAYLLGVTQHEFSIKKGAIWWLRSCESITNDYEILTVQTPNLL